VKTGKRTNSRGKEKAVANKRAEACHGGNPAGKGGRLVIVNIGSFIITKDSCVRDCVCSLVEVLKRLWV
jgi:hypothetical protein